MSVNRFSDGLSSFRVSPFGMSVFSGKLSLPFAILFCSLVFCRDWRTALTCCNELGDTSVLHCFESAHSG